MVSCPDPASTSLIFRAEILNSSSLLSSVKVTLLGNPVKVGFWFAPEGSVKIGFDHVNLDPPGFMS